MTLILNSNSEENILLFAPLHLFDSCSYFIDSDSSCAPSFIRRTPTGQSDAPMYPYINTSGYVPNVFICINFKLYVI